MAPACHVADKMGFLLYDSRSGSTYLAALLDAHPELAVSFESEFLLYAFEEEERDGVPVTGEKLREFVRKDKKLQDWGGDVAEEIMQTTPDITAPQLLERLFEATLLQRRPDARWLILKQGGLTAHVPLLVRYWPNAVFVHIYRDGRGVFNSKSKSLNIDTGKPMQTDAAAAARRWMKVQDDVAQFPCYAKWLNIRYEDLILEQESELPEILRQLGVDAGYDATTDAAKYASNIPEAQKDLHTRVGKGPDKSRLDVWRNELGQEQLAAYESVAGDLLERLGYERTVPKEQPSFFKRLFS